MKKQQATIIDIQQTTTTNLTAVKSMQPLKTSTTAQLNLNPTIQLMGSKRPSAINQRTSQFFRKAKITFGSNQ